MSTPLFEQHLDGIVKNPTHFRYCDRLEKFYFHGIPLGVVMFYDFFRQFGHYYLGHGLCFQTAGLAMLIYRDNPTATLVQGMVYAKEKNLRTSHSWIEFYEFGSRWILDITWNLPMPVPLCVGEDRLGDEEIQRYWTCSYEEFWSSKISTKLYDVISHPETSYILHLLDIYRPAFQPGTQGDVIRSWGFKAGGDDYDGIDNLDYSSAEFRDDIFNRDTATFIAPGDPPVTQGIINAFMRKPGKSLPKKVWRREMAKLSAYAEDSKQ